MSISKANSALQTVPLRLPLRAAASDGELLSDPKDRVTLGSSPPELSIIKRGWNRVKAVGHKLGVDRTALKAGLMGALPLVGMGAVVHHGFQSQNEGISAASLFYGAPMNALGSYLLVGAVATGAGIGVAAVGGALLLGSAAITLAGAATKEPEFSG